MVRRANIIVMPVEEREERSTMLVVSASWDAYDQHYWPARYLIDTDGFIRHQHYGEGAYEENEEEIQKLLSEREEVSS
jgi:hypothetical protein